MIVFLLLNLLAIIGSNAAMYAVLSAENLEIEGRGVMVERVQRLERRIGVLESTASQRGFE